MLYEMQKGSFSVSKLASKQVCNAASTRPSTFTQIDILSAGTKSVQASAIHVYVAMSWEVSP